MVTCRTSPARLPFALGTLAWLALFLSCLAQESPAPGEETAESKTEAVSEQASSDTSSLPEVDGITFAVNPGRYYLPVDELPDLLGWTVEHDEEAKKVTLNQSTTYSYSELRRFVEGPYLVHMTHLIATGAVIEKSEDRTQVTVTYGKRGFVLVAGPQKTRVDLTTQRLKSWQGDRLVLDCHISSGRYGTPVGKYTAGPYKSRRHYSRLFNGAAMPYSVQFHEHYFVHGFTSVPNYPASKGCIRMHLDQGNPARFFYEWVKVGSPFEVYRSEKKP